MAITGKYDKVIGTRGSYDTFALVQIGSSFFVVNDSQERIVERFYDDFNAALEFFENMVV